MFYQTIAVYIIPALNFLFPNSFFYSFLSIFIDILLTKTKLMRKQLRLVAIAVLLFSQLIAQTTRTVTGNVTDAKGVPLAGATVTVLGADRKVTATSVTDSKGAFSVKVADKSRGIQVTYIGMEEQIISVAGKSTVNIVLSAGSSNLDEVVVVGYGTQKKKEVTGSTSSIKGGDVAQKANQSFDQALAGRAAGVQITIPSGVLNSPPVFRIRGTNSISLSSYPLIIVDGVPSYTGDFSSTNAAGNALASINPNDIESVDIAKDAAATAIYGSRAANGVVFITTKKGKAGKVQVTYDGSASWTNVYGLPHMMNAAQYLAFKTQAVANNPSQAAVKFVSTNGPNGSPIDTRWFDYIYRQGTSQSHNVSLSGGNDATKYYFSAGYTNQEGIVNKNGFNRMSVLFNVNSNVSKTISIGGRISYSDEKNTAATSSGALSGEAFNTGGLGRNGMVLPPILSPYNNDGSYNINGATIGYANNVIGTSISYYNPVPILDLSRSNSETNRIMSNAYLQYKPLPWLSFKSLYGIDYLLVDNDIFQTPVTGDGYSSTGNASDLFGKYKTWDWQNTVNIDYTFGSKHNVSFLGGSEQQRRTSSGYGINRQSLSDPAYNLIQAGFTVNNPTGMVYGENYLLSSFARLKYDYNRKYFLEGTIRQDEASQLGVKKGVFWSGSAAWAIDKEKVWSSAGLDRVFSSFRIRGSYGKVGNISGIGDYTPYSTYGSGLYGGLATLTFSSVGNNLLQWETSKKTDVGFSFGILKDRITGEFAYYKNNIDNLILNVAQSPSTGLPSNPPQNVGTMTNKGVELQLNARIVEAKDFSWTSNFNLSFNTNVVNSLAPGLTVIQTGTSGLETVNQTAPGYSQGYLWVIRTAGVDATTGKRIFLNSAGTPVYYQNYAPAGQFNYSTTADGTTKYISPSGGTAITQAADAVMYKNTQPKQYGGWDNTFKYKNFDVNVLLTYQLGFYVYYGTNAGLHDQRFWNNATDVLTDAWATKGDANKTWAKPVFGDNVSNGSAMPMDINVYKGDFVKLRNVSIGYTLPRNLLAKAKISSARVYISGQNLAIMTKYPGPDPEVSSNGTANGGQGVDRNTVANARTITLGLNIGF